MVDPGVKGLNTTGGSNKHRYRSFAQRIAAIDVDVAHVIRAEHELAAVPAGGDTDCFLREELNRWTELDVSAAFCAFVDEVFPLVQSMALLVHHQEKVVAAFMAFLQPKYAVAHQALLSLLATLARDLRSELLPHFKPLVTLLVGLIDPKQPERTGDVFRALSFLFKYLAKGLLADMDSVRAFYGRLLGHRKPFVRDFAAESFAFLLRKLSPQDAKVQISNLVKAMGATDVQRPPELLSGVALLLIHTIKSVQYSLHSNAGVLLPAIFHACRPKSAGSKPVASTEEENSYRTGLHQRWEILHQLMGRTIAHVSADFSDLVWRTLHKEIQEATSNTIGEADATRAETFCMYLSRLLGILKHCVAYRGGVKWSTQEAKRISEFLSQATGPQITTPALGPARIAFLQLLLAAWSHLSMDDRTTIMKRVADVKALRSADPAATAVCAPDVLSFLLELLHAHAADHAIILKPVLAWCGELLNTPVADSVWSFFVALRSLIDTHVLSDVVLPIQAVPSITSGIESGLRLVKHDKFTDERCQRLWPLLVSSRVFAPSSNLVSVLHPLLDQMTACAQPTAAQALVRAELISSVAWAARYSSFNWGAVQPAKLVEQAISWFTQSCDLNSVAVPPAVKPALLGLLELVRTVQQSEEASESGARILTTAQLESLLVPVAPALSCDDHDMRLAAIQLLCCFPQPPFQVMGSDMYDIYSGPCTILQEALTVESEPNVLASERIRTSALGRMVNMVASKRVPRSLAAAVASHMCGLFHVTFAPLWPAVRPVIAALTSSYPADTWNVLCPIIAHVAGALTGSTSTASDVQLFATAASDAATVGRLRPSAAALTAMFDDAVKSAGCLIELFHASRSPTDSLARLVASGKTDSDTVHTQLLETLASVPAYAESKSRTLSILFLLFLRDDYLEASRRDTTESRDLRLTETLKQLVAKLKHKASTSATVDDRVLAVLQQSINGSSRPEGSVIGHRSSTARLINFLKLFKHFTNWSSIVGVDALYAAFHYLLIKQDWGVAGLALDCLLSFRKPELAPYADYLRRLVADATYRDTLLRFSIDPEDGVLLSEHRTTVVPIVVRLLLGRIQQRKGRTGRDTPATRRAAVLSYMSRLPQQEMKTLFETIMRPFESIMSAQSVSADTWSSLRSAQVVGYIRLQAGMVKLLGTKILDWVSNMLQLNLAILNAPVAGAEDDLDKFPVATDDKSKVIGNLAALLDQFAGLFDFTPWYKPMLTAVHTQLVALPGSCANANRPPALLRLIMVMSAQPALRPGLVVDPQLIPLVIACLSAGVAAGHGPGAIIVFNLIDIMSQWLKVNARGEPIETGGTPLLAAHLSTLLSQFVARIGAGGVSRKSLSKRELAFLASVSELVAESTDADLCTQMVTLMLPSLKSATRMSEEAQISVVRIMQRLILKVQDPSGFVPFLCARMGTGQEAVSSHLLRQELVKLLVVLGQHPACKYLRTPTELMADMNAMDPTMVEEPDYERQIRALLRVAGSETEASCAAELIHSHPYAALPVVHAAMHGLHNGEAGVRGAALRALKAVVTEAVAMSVGPAPKLDNNILCSVVFPGIRNSFNGPKLHTDVVQLLAFTVRLVASKRQVAAAAAAAAAAPAPEPPATAFGKKRRVAAAAATAGVTANASDTQGTLTDATFKALHGDLACLLHDDPEADVFNNLVHIQLHRQVRALAKIREHVVAGDMEESSLRHFLLPAALGMLFQRVRATVSRKKSTSNDALQVESGQLVAAIAAKLPWSGYSGLIRSLMRDIERYPELEKILARTLAGVVDSFHFDTSPELAVPEEDAASIADSEASAEDAEEVETKDTEGAAEEEEEDAEESEEERESDDEQAAPRRQRRGKAAAKAEDEEDAALRPEPEAVPDEAGAAGEAEDIERKAPEFKPVVAESEIRTPNPILKTLVSSILPALGRLLVKAGTEEMGIVHEKQLRAPVAVALVKLLKQLPVHMFHGRLPQVLASVIDRLKSRAQSIRDDACQTMVRIATALGPQYMKFILTQLHDTLREGFQLFVMGHATHAVMEALHTSLLPNAVGDDSAAVAALDAAGSATETKAGDAPAATAATLAPLGPQSTALIEVTPLLMEIIMDDIAGNRAAARASGSFNPSAQLKEAKSCKAFDTFSILCHCIPFLPHEAIHAVLSPVVAILDSPYLQERVRDAIEELLRRGVVALANNPSVSAPHLLVYVHALLGEYTPAVVDERPQPANEKKKKLQTRVWQVDEELSAPLPANKLDLMKIEPLPKLTGWGRHLPSSSGTRSTTTTLYMVRFGLSLMYTAMKKHLVMGSRPRHRLMLEPFGAWLLRLLRQSKESKVVMLCLKCLASMLPMQLGWVLGHSTVLTKAVLNALQQASGSAQSKEGQRSDLAETAIRTFGMLLRQCRALRVSDSQLAAVLQLIRADLEIPGRQNATFAVIRAILSRRLMTPEVYDVMDHVGRLLVRSLRSNARQLCAQTFMAFLLHYPLGPKRLQQHLNHLITNLSYKYEDGRLAVLDMLHALVLRFPDEVLNDSAAFLFLPMVVRLVEDDSSRVRAALGTVVQLLLKRVSVAVGKDLIGCVEAWLNPNGKPLLRRAAAQVLGLAIDVRIELVEHRLDAIVPALFAELNAAAAADEESLYGQALHVVAGPREQLEDAHALQRAEKLGALADAAVSEEPDADGGFESDSETEAPESTAQAHIADSEDDEASQDGEQEETPAPAPAPAPASAPAPVPTATTAAENDDGWTVVPAGGLVPALMPEMNGERPKFIPAASFNGSKVGYVYKSGDNGLGYYADEAAKQAVPTVSSDNVVDTNPQWRSAYYSIVCLDKLLGRNSALFADSEAQAVGVIQRLLLYPHAWVRLACSRLLGRWLSVGVNEASFTQAAAARAPEGMLHNKDTLFLLCKRLCGQLTSDTLSPKAAEQTVRDLLFIACAAFHSTADKDRFVPKADVQADGSDDEQEPEHEGEGEADSRPGADPLNWTLHRLAALARHDLPVTRTAAITCMGGIAAKLPGESLKNYLVPYVRPLQNIINRTSPIPSEELVQLAQQLFDLLQERITDGSVLTVWTRIREQKAEARANVKRQRALQAVLDPAAAAARKIRRSQQKVQQKKRRIASYRDAEGRQRQRHNHRVL